MNRREFVGSVAGTLAGLSGRKRGIAANLGAVNNTDYMTPAPGGRVFHSLAQARATTPKAGDVVLIRDMGEIAPSHIYSGDTDSGKWSLRTYHLADGQSGRLLLANRRVPAEDLLYLPEEFEIRLHLPGWYAIWAGVPLVDLAPTITFTFGGVDLALDTDPAFVSVEPERGTRLGKIMGPMNVEVTCYWKCAKLDGRSLRVRVPYGTYLSLPWGMVRASLSCLKLVRLSEQQIEGYESDISNPKTKRVIVVNDGFSAYWAAGEPGKGIDGRFPQQYGASDVKMYFLQTPSTGVASWPSKVTDLLGEDVTKQQWKLLRLGDRRAYEYFQWAVKNHQEGFRVASALCRTSGLQFHASLRMNLFFRNEKTTGQAVEELLNGPFWWSHPELRKPGSVQLDYGQPKVREYVLAILMELATNYDEDGVNLDFTRWPPIADPARDNFSLLTNFIAETRRRLDVVASRKNRKLALSAMVVDGYHARRNGRPMSLEEQKIDLEAWLASGTLDFICVEAWDHSKHLALAKRFHTPYYAIQDQESIKVPGGHLDDPDWLVEGHRDHDPLPGEELESQPPVNASLDPMEYDQAFLPRYRMGVDGACIVNGGGNFLRRLGHMKEMAERVKTGKVWGQRIGPRIKIF
jgi:hypothetical protein